MKILDKIRSMLADRKSTSAEIQAAIADLDISGAETAIAERQAERRALLLTGTDAEIEKADAAIRAAEIELDRRRAMAEALQGKLVEAEAAELLREVEARGKRAAEIAADMEAMYATIDQTAAALAAHLAALSSARAELKAHNAFTGEHGRSDLKASDPIGLLAQQLGRPVDSVATFTGWRFDPYWPAPAHAGTAPLARIVDLPVAAARKAA
ncbi:MAG: hypothetical protein AB7O63_13180 [Reyranellaceae bacterium]